MRKILSASWSWQEFNEFLSAYSDTLYDKHKIKSWADERIEDEGYGMNNEWQAGQIEVPRGKSRREKIPRLGLQTSRQFPEVSRKVSGNLESFHSKISGKFPKNLEIQKERNYK